MGLCGRKVEDDVGALSCISMALSVLVMQIYINISNYKPVGIKKSHFLSLSRRFRRFFVFFTQMTQISQVFFVFVPQISQIYFTFHICVICVICVTKASV